MRNPLERKLDVERWWELFDRIFATDVDAD
jgi:hypothetical protein